MIQNKNKYNFNSLVIKSFLTTILLISLTVCSIPTHAQNVIIVGRPQAQITNNQTQGANCDDLLFKDYSFGAENNTIKQLQQCMKDKGYFDYSGGITGYFGNYTLSQLRKYKDSKKTTSSTLAISQPTVQVQAQAQSSMSSSSPRATTNSNVIVVTYNNIGTAPIPNVAQTNNNLITTVTDNELYSLPDKFNSADKINNFLQSQGSFLYNYQVDISLESDDDIFPGISQTMKNKLGSKIRFADMIWELSRTSFGDFCSVYDRNVCVDNNSKPINPAYILGMIQRESGLIYGGNAKLNPNSEDANFLIDRATGYYCYETNVKKDTCYDENPSWKFYKGLFRQTFYMIRLQRLYSKRCDSNGVNINGNVYATGRTRNIDDSTMTPGNGLTCALFIYTPHFAAQNSLRKVMDYLK